MSVSSVVPVHTWESGKGNLSLLQQENSYSLSFETKDHQTIQISEKNIQGISFDKITSQVDEVCRDYFFKVIGHDAEISILFFKAINLDHFEKIQDPDSGEKGTFGFEFNTLERKLDIKPSDAAPYYRTVGQGLNLEGKCVNEVCPALNKYVIVHKGLGEFHLAEELDKSECPACGKNIPFEEMINLGFWDSSYNIRGKKIKPYSLNVNRNDKVVKGYYRTFVQGEDCTWAYLNVTAEAQTSSRCVLL